MNVFPSLNFTLELVRNYSWLFLYSLIAVLALVYFFRLIRFWQNLRQESVFLELVPPRNTEISSFTTTQLFQIISGLLRQQSFTDRLLLRQLSSSLEIASQKETGIRYLLRLPKALAEPAEKSLLAYIPGLQIKEAADYLPVKLPLGVRAKVLDFKLAGHFALPLNEQVDLGKHDPLLYLTSNMTQLKENETLAIQLVLRPLTSSAQRRVRRNAVKLQLPDIVSQRSVDKTAAGIESLVQLAMTPLFVLAEFVTGQKTLVPCRKISPAKSQVTAQDMDDSVCRKVDQQLFEGSLRALLIIEPKQLRMRERGLVSAFMSFLHPAGQSLSAKRNLLWKVGKQLRWWQYKNRLNNRQLILSSSEVGALYHFPYTKLSRTEDFNKSKSQELPTPLSFKNRTDLDVVFGHNYYGNRATEIGLTDDERSRHMYLIGQTGSGKSTAIYHMAKGDIQKGRGVAVIDPHGDLAEDLLATVPEERINDVIYFNPFDIAHPIGINLLELPPGLTEDELELEKEFACESIVSIFRRIFNKGENTDAHRIEYILRNTIHTAFTVEDATIFTVYELLNNPQFQKQVIGRLKDENLRSFWKNEFGKAGDYQIVKMVGGVTAKIGRFLFSPIAKRILEQPKSTINFESILDNQKILICNLAEGRIGEDTSQLLGTIVIAKIHQAAQRRARKELSSRTPFYLFVDEFQNFATSSFTKLLSGGRKFGLRITIAEQSTAQQSDRSIVDVILANTGVVVCFRTASPVDEELMLAQFSPLVKNGDIANLPRHKFYMRLAAIEAEDPFSGETIPINHDKDPEKLNALINASRKNYAIVYQKPEPPVVGEILKREPKIDPAKPKKTLGSISKKRAAADPELNAATG